MIKTVQLNNPILLTFVVLSENDITGLMSFEIGKILSLYPFELIEFLQKNNQAKPLGGDMRVDQNHEHKEDGEDDIYDEINFSIVDLRLEKNDLYLPFTIDIPAAAHSNAEVLPANIRLHLIACWKVCKAAAREHRRYASLLHVYHG